MRFYYLPLQFYLLIMQKKILTVYKNREQESKKVKSLFWIFIRCQRLLGGFGTLTPWFEKVVNLTNPHEVHYVMDPQK